MEGVLSTGPTPSSFYRMSKFEEKPKYWFNINGNKKWWIAGGWFSPVLEFHWENKGGVGAFLPKGLTRLVS